jgi:hypothetical protein
VKNIEMVAAANKPEWVRPQLKHLDAGSAESRDGPAGDGGGGLQGS